MAHAHYTHTFQFLPKTAQIASRSHFARRASSLEPVIQRNTHGEPSSALRASITRWVSGSPASNQPSHVSMMFWQISQLLTRMRLDSVLAYTA